MAELEARWWRWEAIQERWGQLRADWNLPRTYATAPFFFRFFHALPRLSVEVLTLTARDRLLALFPVAVRRRLGFFQEGHAMPWAMPGGVWISPAVPETRRTEVLQAIRNAVRRFGYFTFLDRFGTVGLAWRDLPVREVVHHVLLSGTPPHDTVQRTLKKARARYAVRVFGPEDLEGLYPVYVAFQKTKRSPFLDRQYFEIFFQTVPPENRIALGLVRDGAWAGGVLGFGDGEEALLFHIFLDASARREGGFHLLVTEAAQTAKQRGFSRVDLGHHPGRQPGLDYVKQRLGAAEERANLIFFPAWMHTLRGAGNRVWHRRRIRP